MPGLCKRHGGGYRCQIEGCGASAVNPSNDRCVTHAEPVSAQPVAIYVVPPPQYMSSEYQEQYMSSEYQDELERAYQNEVERQLERQRQQEEDMRLGQDVKKFCEAFLPIMFIIVVVCILILLLVLGILCSDCDDALHVKDAGITNAKLANSSVTV